MSVQIPNAQAVALLDAITAAATGVFDGAKVMLFQNEITLLPTTVLADLTAADFSGYALSAAVVWAAAGFNADGVPIVTAAAITFTRGAGAVSNNIWGWGLVNGAANTLLWARRLDAAIPMTTVGQSIIVLPLLDVGQPPDLSPNDVI